MPQDEPRLDGAVVAVDLEPTAASTGSPAAPAASRRARMRRSASARPPGRERERDVRALAHRARLGAAARSGRAAPAPGCPSRTARAARAPPRGRAGARRPARRRRPAGGHQVGGREHRGGVRDERRAERVDAVARDRQPGGGAVAAVAQQVGARGIEPAEQVESRDRPARAGALVAVECDQHRGAMMALGDPRGDDPDHARMPTVGGEHVGRRAGGDSATSFSASNRIRVSTSRRSWLTASSSAATARARCTSAVSSSSSPASARCSRPAALIRGASRKPTRRRRRR